MWSFFNAETKGSIMTVKVKPDQESVFTYYQLQLGQTPPDGWVVVWTQAHGIFAFHTSELTALAAKVCQLQSQADVYVGMALQKMKPEPGKRGTGANTAAICGVWIEIDCREGVHKEKPENLPTKEQALAILEGLPITPTVILDSGGGYHAHWWFDGPLVFHTDEERQRGQELVRGFQHAVADVFRDQGYKVDTTSDLARVLRPPLTFNHKSETPVQVEVTHYVAEARYTVELLETYCQHMSTPDQLQANSALVTSAVGDQDIVKYPPAELDPVMNGCAWLRHCRDDAANLPEPEWFAALSIVARCIDGQRHAHAISAPYPGYSFPETETKIAQALRCGPRTCSNIRVTLNGSRHCDKCQHLINKSSPITLGFRKSTAASGAGFNMTDAGNAELFAKVNAMDVRYVWAWDTWILFDGTRWKIDNQGRVFQKGIATLRYLATQARLHLQPSDAETISEHALSSESASGIKNMLFLAKTDPSLAVIPDMLDTDQWLLNLQNGTIDLRDNGFRPHSRDDLLTKVAGVAYDAEAACPLWEAFLDRIMDRNRNLIEFLQRFAGYTLSGVSNEQCLILLYGTGANGKSVFLEIIRFVLKDYASQADFSTFAASKSQGIGNDLARLVGVRFVSVVESEHGQPFAEATIKKSTGGDPIVARFLYKEIFEFYAQFKLWFASNHKPIVKGGDHGIWRRIKLVPFVVKIPEHEQDPNLIFKLKEEGPGILNWMLRGCREWQAQGLNPPPEVTQAVAEYRGEMDLLAEFLEEHCVIGIAEKVKAKNLHKAYRDFCEAEGEYPLGKKRFADMLLQRGFRKAKSGDIVWQGIGLKQVAAPVPWPGGGFPSLK